MARDFPSLDEAVLAAARRGDPAAFRVIHERLAGPVSGYLRGHGAADPDGLTSAVFLGVFQGIAGFEGDVADFRSWVFTIAHRRLVDERRQRGREATVVPLDRDDTDRPQATHPEPSEALDELEQADRIRTLLDELTVAQREVVLLRFVAGLSTSEVADAMGRTDSAVRVLQHRALSALRERLSDEA